MTRLVTGFAIFTILTFAFVAQGLAQQPQTQPDKFTLTLTPPQLDLVYEGTGELPSKRVEELRAVLRAQIQQQLQAARKASEPEKPK